MGEELCKGCQNNESLSNNEGDLSKISNFPINNTKIDNALTIKNTLNTKNSLFEINENEKSSQRIKMTNPNTNINTNFIESSPDIIDQNELVQIKKKYKVNLIIKLFKKLKQLKNEAHLNIISEYNNEEREFEIKINSGELNLNLFPENDFEYIGSKFNDKYDGFGKQIFKETNSTFMCNFLNGHRTNICKFQNGNLNILYHGYVKDYFAEGYGICKNENSNISYEGYWENNLKNGIGIEIYDNGNIYKGEFKNGKKEGIGVYTWNDNSVYSGEWENDNLNGEGIYQFKDGSIYYGSWKNNQMDGFGEFTYPNTKTYLGYFKKDKKNGFGIVFWENNEKCFIGFWKNNKQNGLGKFISQGKVRFGTWKDGKKDLKYDNYEDFKNMLVGEDESFVNIFNYDYDEIGKLLYQIREL